eukprot:scaffold80407_cov36-Tisochrysis_lutea.AAC.1
MAIQHRYRSGGFLLAAPRALDATSCLPRRYAAGGDNFLELTRRLLISLPILYLARGMRLARTTCSSRKGGVYLLAQKGSIPEASLRCGSIKALGLRQSTLLVSSLLVAPRRRWQE